MGDFKKTTIGNLVEFQRGFDLPKSQFNYGKYPVRSSNGVLGYHNEFKTKAPGITIGRSGTVGIPHYIDEDFFPHNTTLFIKDFKGNYPKYIYYLIQNLKLNDWKSGSGVPTLNRNHIHPIKISAYLNKQSQKQIAKVLSDLDAKIEVNNQINAKLEAMAKALYEYWFVQFDFPSPPTPEGGAIQGKPYKSSGGKMVFNEELKREIPEGWEVKSLVDIENNIITGKTPSTLIKENFGDEIKFITIDDIRRNRFVINTERSLSKLGADTQINKYLYPNDICVSCIGTVGVVGFVSSKSQSNQQINSISTPRYYNRYYLYHYLKDFFEYNVGAKKGAVLSNMNKGEFESITVLNPPTSIKKKYFKIVHSFYEQQHKLIKQNQKLAELRDWLLPMLMNGQVSVGDAMEYVSGDHGELGMVAED